MIGTDLVSKKMVRTKMANHLTRGGPLSVIAPLTKENLEAHTKLACADFKKNQKRILIVSKPIPVKSEWQMAIEADMASYQKSSAGWIYCVTGGGENIYKCGMTKNKGTRQEIEKSLWKRYGSDDYYFTVFHLVPVSNAPDAEKILFAGLSRYRLDARELFKVDDVGLIKYAMNILPI